MRTNKIERNGNHIFQDIGLIALSILIAVILVKTGVLTQLLLTTEKVELIGSFISGAFFTSIFTTAPAMAALGQISLAQGIFATALVGAAGSVIGDLVIFRFVRNRFAEHIEELLQHTHPIRRAHVLFKRRIFRWFTFLVGGLILASPLPDELGIAVLGFSKMRFKYFVALSFAFNFFGILLIGYVAHSLAS